jgi:alpha-glucosidase
VEAQTGDPASMLELYRSALGIRGTEPGLGDGPMAWLDAQEGVLAFSRDDTFACVVNLADSAVSLPPHVEVLLASGPLDGSNLPSDTAVWLRT